MPIVYQVYDSLGGQRGVEGVRVGREGDTPEVEIGVAERPAVLGDAKALEVGDGIPGAGLDEVVCVENAPGEAYEWPLWNTVTPAQSPVGR